MMPPCELFDYSAPANSRKLEQQNLAFSCTGDVRTVFGGRTLGTIVYQGETYYASVYPPSKRGDCEV